MQSLGMIVTAGLGLLVVAEGAYIVRTRSQLATLTEKVEALSTAAHDDPFGRSGGGHVGNGAGLAASDEEPVEAPRGAAVHPTPKLPPPRFTPEPAAADTGDPLPLPAAIATPEAREQLRQFVVAQLERERQEARVRDEQRMATRSRERRLAAIQPLGLNPSETDKFLAITDQIDAARSSLRDRIESGQLDRGGVRQEMTALREKSDRELQGLLGDARMKQYEQIRREQGPPEGAGLGGGGFGRGGFGRRGQGGPPGAAPPGPQGP